MVDIPVSHQIWQRMNPAEKAAVMDKVGYRGSVKLTHQACMVHLNKNVDEYKKHLDEALALDEAVHSPYRNASIALRNLAFDPNTSESDRGSYNTHADLLRSKDPKDHETSAKLAQRHDTAVRDEISNAVHHNSSKVNSAKYHKAAGWSRLKEDADLDEGLADDFLAVAKKVNPNAKMRGSVEDQKKERDAMIAKREKENADKPKAAPQPYKEKYPLGGYDPKSGRSYSEQVEQPRGDSMSAMEQYVAALSSDKTAGEMVTERKMSSVDLMVEIAKSDGVKIGEGVELDESKQHSDMTDDELKKHIATRTRNALAHNLSRSAADSLRAAQTELKKRQHQEIAEGAGTTESPAQLDELSKDTLERYASKATADHTHQNMARRNTTGEVQKQFAQKEKARKQGISRAYDRIYPQNEQSTQHGGVMTKMEQYIAAIESLSTRLGGSAEPPRPTTESVDTVVKDKDGNVVSWKHEGDPHKIGAKKDPIGKMYNLSDKARRETEKLAKQRADKAKADLDEEQLDELSKDTLAKYAKAAPRSAAELDGRAKEMSTIGHLAKQDDDHKQARKFFSKAGGLAYKSAMRQRGHDKAIDRLTKEEVDLEESMVSYSDFMDKIAMHKKAGNQIKDYKYDDKKASYTVVDRDGVGKKITHTAAGAKQEHLGNMKRDDSDDGAEVKQKETRRRGRPAGSKSGARHTTESAGHVAHTVGDEVRVKFPARHKGLTGKVEKVYPNNMITVKHTDGSARTYHTSDLEQRVDVSR